MGDSEEIFDRNFLKAGVNTRRDKGFRWSFASAPMRSETRCRLYHNGVNNGLWTPRSPIAVKGCIKSRI